MYVRAVWINGKMGFTTGRGSSFYPYTNPEEKEKARYLAIEEAASYPGMDNVDESTTEQGSLRCQTRVQN